MDIPDRIPNDESWDQIIGIMNLFGELAKDGYSTDPDDPTDALQFTASSSVELTVHDIFVLLMAVAAARYVSLEEEVSSMFKMIMHGTGATQDMGQTDQVMTQWADEDLAQVWDKLSSAEPA
jgi:hypothetical protein